MAGQWNVSWLSAGLPAGGMMTGSATLIGAAQVGETLAVSLASGDNTVVVPAGAISVLVVPPSTNSVALKVRTNLDSADAGLPVSASDPFGPYSFRGLSVTSLIINAASTVAGVQITFI